LQTLFGSVPEAIEIKHFPIKQRGARKVMADGGG